MPLGTDLYERYDKVINWEQLARSIAFTWIKVTDGTSRALYPADAYVTNAANHLIPWGPYHYALAGHPVLQAEEFLREIDRLGWQPDGQHLIPALDFEDKGIRDSESAGLARVFLETVHSATHGKVALYADETRLKLLTPENWGYNWLTIWVASWGNNDGQHHVVAGYHHPFDVQQFTSNGRLPGIQGRVDLDWTDNLTALLANGDTMTPEQVWDQELTRYIRPGDTDQRETAPAWQILSYGNEAAWIAADAARQTLTQVNAIAGALPPERLRLLTVLDGVQDGHHTVADVAEALGAIMPLDQLTEHLTTRAELPEVGPLGG